MHLRKALAIGALLVVSTSMTACGNSDGDGKATSGTGNVAAGANPANTAGTADTTNTAGQKSAGGLPKAADMASIADHLNKYTSCLDLATGDDYDANHDGDKTAWGADEAADPSWAIKERAVCTDGSGRPIALLTVSDMAKFQTAAKANSDEFLVGQDFAVVPVGDEAVRALQKSDLKFLTCDADFSAPSGFEKEPGLVDGCVLTNYVPE